MIRVQITLRMPQGHILLKTYENAFAQVDHRSRVLQIYRETLRDKVIIAEFHEDAYLSWEYVPSQHATSRAQQVLHHHEK